MHSAIVLVPAPLWRSARLPEAAARTLASLVAGVTGEAVCAAILVGPRDARLATLADQAGCAYIAIADGAREEEARGWAEALRRVRTQRIFAVEAGVAPARDYVEELKELAVRPDAAAALRLEPSGLWTRLFADQAPLVGLSAPTATAAAAPPETWVETARRLRARAMRARAFRV